MTDTLTTADLAWSAALRFLRSAVALDDKPVRADVEVATDVETPPEVDLLKPPAETTGEDVATALPAAPEAAPVEPVDADAPIPDVQDSSLNEDALVGAFANVGIACAVLKPDALGNYGARALERADLLILDWRLGDGDDGGLATTLLQQLAEHPADSGQRLVAIYTSAPDLGQIRDTVVAEVAGAIADGLEPFTIRFSAVTVMVIGKESNPAGLSAGALPQHLVSAFAKAIEGIVPIATVNALAAVRDGLPGLIARLGTELDRGYVRHCLLLDHADEGSAHLTALIGDELRSLVTADGATVAVSDVPRMGAWLDEQEAAGGLVVPAAKIKEHLSGAVRISQASGGGASAKKPHHVIKPVDPLSPEHDDALLADRMTFRALRFDQSAAMVPGVVLSRPSGDGDSEYFVCIQPSCDAVRLYPPAAQMPFLQCEEKLQGFDFALRDGDVVLRLKVIDRFDRLVHFRFPVDAGSGLIPLVNPLTELNLDGSTGASFRVMGVLRDEYARRLGQQIGNRLGRMGLDESEWQRLKARF